MAGLGPILLSLEPGVAVMVATRSLVLFRPDAGDGLPSPRVLWARWRLRAELRRLLEGGPHMLADVGLTADEVKAELAKPIWRA